MGTSTLPDLRFDLTVTLCCVADKEDDEEEDGAEYEEPSSDS